MTNPPGQPQQLYVPRDEGRNDLGAQLHRMQREGRKIVEGERDRYSRNRELFRGNSYAVPGTHTTSVRGLSESTRLRGGRSKDKVNRLRQFTEGHVSMLSARTPPFEVVPPNHSRDAHDGARLGTKLVKSQWRDPNGWNIARFGRTLARQGALDGIAFACVNYDKGSGEEVDAPVAITPQGPKPVETQAQMQSLIDQDPSGGTLWINQKTRVGKVVMRVVKAGYMSVDPNCEDDWRDARWCCESRRRPLAELEEIAGRPLLDLLKQNGTGHSFHSKPAAEPSGRYEKENTKPSRGEDPYDSILVHDMYIKPQGATSEWPQGAHIMWMDPLPSHPIIQEPWVDPHGKAKDLPYHPYTPRPDGGNIFRCLSLVDELAPLQTRLDRTYSQVGDHLDLVAKPPLLLNGGSLRSSSVFNEERLVVTNPGFSEPHFMDVPSEPAAAMSNFVNQIEGEMAELSAQLDPVRGAAPGHGVDASVSINMLIEQAEQMNGAAAEEYTQTLEWAIGTALKNVTWYWSLGQTITSPGVEDEAEFQAFHGAKLRGATDFRITGSVLPKQRSAQLEMLRNFMQYAGERFDPVPYMADIIDGNVESIVEANKMHHRKQANENRKIAGFGSHPQRDLIWQSFSEMREQYAQMMDELAQLQSPDPVQMQYNQALLQWAQGQAPNLTEMMNSLGLTVPTPYPLDNDVAHVQEMERFAADDGYDGYHPLVKQLFLDHFNAHIAKRGQNYNAMHEQQGPDPQAQVQAMQADQQFEVGLLGLEQQDMQAQAGGNQSGGKQANPS